jgi:hypothetical protein
MTEAPERRFALDLDSLPARSPSLISAEIETATVLYDGTSDSLHLLDPVASIVWNLLDGTATLRQICADVADAFYTSEDRVRDDVLRLVSDLANHDLILQRLHESDVSLGRFANSRCDEHETGGAV